MGFDYKKRLNPDTPPAVINVAPEVNKRLGSGLSLPLQITDSKWDTILGLGKLKQDIYTVLLTPVGRRYNQPDFGSLLPMLLMEQWTSTLKRNMESATKNCLAKWIPAIIVDSVDILMLADNVITIVLQYTVKGTLDEETFEIQLATNDATKLISSSFTINGRPYFRNN